MEVADIPCRKYALMMFRVRPMQPIMRTSFGFCNPIEQKSDLKSDDHQVCLYVGS